MPKPDKGTEPSMEEILASIRKIIAEEPIGSRFEPVRRNSLPVADPVALAREKAAATGACAPGRLGDAGQGIAQGAGTIRGRPVLDDALADLVEPSPSESAGAAAKPVQGVSLPAAVVPAKIPAGEPRQRPSWLFSHPHPIPNPDPVAKGLRVSSQAGAPLPTPQDVPLAGVRAEPAATTVPDGLLNPTAEASPAVKTPVGECEFVASPSDEANDCGAAVAGQPDALGPITGHDVPSIARPEGVASEPGVEVPIARATAQSAQKAGADPLAAMLGMRSDSAPRRRDGAAPAEVSGSVPSKPGASEHLVCAAVEASPVPESNLAGEPAVEKMDSATVAASSALNALAQGLAASTVAPAKEDSAAAPVTQLVTQPVRTLEDTVADLLRPMLRQWLDANMPRIVEKALRVELADGVKPAVKARSL